MPTYPVRYRLPTSYSTEIGRIITRWAFLEWRLKETAYTLLEISPKEGRLSVIEPSASRYVSMLKDLIFVKKITVKTDLKSLRTGLEKLGDMRNTVAHGIWIRNPNDKRPYVQVLIGKWADSSGTMPRRKIEPEAQPVTLQDLKNVSQSITDATKVIRQLELEIREQILEG